VALQRIVRLSGDIFISYARKDDQAPKRPDAKGLVSSLHDQLLYVFSQFGDPPSIFHDTKRIGRGDQFEPRLGQALRDAKLLVVIMSRNWLDSDWCRRELDTFVKNWKSRGAPEQQIKERLILVRKHNISRKSHPKWLQGQSGYDLFSIDRENGEEISYFNFDLGRDHREEWFTSTGQLGRDLYRRGQNWKGEVEKTAPKQDLRSRAVPSATSNGRTVFVARAASDMGQSRKTLVEELTRRGFQIVPTKALPNQKKAALKVLDAALNGAELSIHLLGEKQGFQPEDAPPIVRLQLERAAARIGASAPEDPRGFHRLIWAPEVMPGALDGAANRVPCAVLGKHSGLAERAKPEEAQQPRDKILGDTFRKFLDFVLDHLAKLAPAASAQLPEIAERADIYVHRHDSDRNVAVTVAEAVRKLDFCARLPAQEGSPAARRQVHLHALRNCDAVLLCWAEAADAWVKSTAAELSEWQKRRAKAFACRAVVALPPARPAKDDFRRVPADVDGVIDATETPSLTPETLEPLLRPLRGARS
jgi:TIR domain